MSDISRLQRGHQAESYVHAAACRRGWQCVTRNFHSRNGELDLVYTSGDRLIVVEVRYRARRDYGRAAATVNRTKQRRIIRATRYFLRKHPQFAKHAVRFDVVGVNADMELDWIENAFYAE